MATEETALIVPLKNFVAFQRAADLKEVVEANFGDRGISIFSLERIRFPSGGGMSWQIMSPEGVPSETKELICAIPSKRDERNFWKMKYGQGSGNAPPDCHSDDLITGYGDNGTDEKTGVHKCLGCPQNQWLPDEQKGGKSKKCREIRLMFLLRQGNEKHIFPSLLTISPGSLKSLDGYLTSLTSQGIIYSHVLHRLTLAQAKSQTNVSYAQVKCETLRHLTEDELVKMKAYSQALRGAFQALRVTEEDAPVE